MSDQLLDVLNALIKLELKIGELYESCARRWPEDDQFWLEVAHQEAFHARVIERMSLLISNNPAHYVPAKVIHVAAVNTIISGIDRKMELLRIGQLLKVNALTIAIDLEESVMEKNFYEMVKTADPVFLQLCHDIRNETYEHRERFKKRLAQLKT